MKSVKKGTVSDIGVGFEGARAHFLPSHDANVQHYVIPDDTFPYLARLYSFTSEFDGNPDERTVASRQRDCRTFLLDFAEHLFADGNPMLWPYSAVMAAVVAAQDAKTHYDEIKTVFDRLDREFEDIARYGLGEKTDKLMAFVAYFCAARLLPFETAFGQRLHGRVDAILNAALERSETDYTDMLVIGMKGQSTPGYAPLFPAGESLLLTHFQSTVQGVSDYSKSPEATPSTIAENLVFLAELAGGLSIQLCDETLMGMTATHVFAESMHDLMVADEMAAQELVRAGQNLYAWQEDPNPSFIEVVEKARLSLESRKRPMHQGSVSAAARAAARPLAQPR
ncbi:MAG: hypothetical protein KGI37_00800 [Alphaproteobacteria bacterium]|nr:hypothetical protein [Alphaproteobacteria bacterium]